MWNYSGLFSLSHCLLKHFEHAGENISSTSAVIVVSTLYLHSPLSVVTFWGGAHQLDPQQHSDAQIGIWLTEGQCHGDLLHTYLSKNSAGNHRIEKHLALLALICHNQRISAENVQESNIVQSAVVLIMYDPFLLYISDVNYQTENFWWTQIAYFSFSQVNKSNPLIFKASCLIMSSFFLSMVDF